MILVVSDDCVRPLRYQTYSLAICTWTTPVITVSSYPILLRGDEPPVGETKPERDGDGEGWSSLSIGVGGFEAGKGWVS